MQHANITRCRKNAKSSLNIYNYKMIYRTSQQHTLQSETQVLNKQLLVQHFVCATSLALHAALAATLDKLPDVRMHKRVMYFQASVKLLQNFQFERNFHGK